MMRDTNAALERKRRRLDRDYAVACDSNQCGQNALLGSPDHRMQRFDVQHAALAIKTCDSMEQNVW